MSRRRSPSAAIASGANPEKPEAAVSPSLTSDQTSQTTQSHEALQYLSSEDDSVTVFEAMQGPRSAQAFATPTQGLSNTIQPKQASAQVRVSAAGTVVGSDESDDGSDTSIRATLLQPLCVDDGSKKVPETTFASMTRKVAEAGETKIGKQLYVALVILFFAGSSLGAIFINKTCLTGYHFRYPLVLMLGQMVFAVFVLTILHATDYMKIPTLHRNDLPMIMIPTVLFMSNVIVGLSALSLVNIPMFSAFRRLTLLFVMGAEYILLKKTHSPSIIAAIVAMTFGAFISALDDVTFSRLGYFLVFLNNLLTALYLAAIKRVMRETEFEPLSLLYYTALMGAPIVAFLILVTGELRSVVTAFNTQPELLTPGFLTSLTLTATGAFAVNFSTSLCTHVTSPLTTSVAGQVKNIFQTILGFWSWGFVPTRMNVAGLLVALAAQLVFAAIKYKENKEGEEEGSKSGTNVSPDSPTEDSSRSKEVCVPFLETKGTQNV